MSLDSSLKDNSRLSGRRNVLTRAERITKMQEEGAFNPEEDSPFGLPKYRVIQSRAGSKKKTTETAETEASAETVTDSTDEAAESTES